MTDQEIQEGNIILAEFMGFEKLKGGYNWDGFGWFHPLNMFFHKDWSWLMPVVEKIEQQDSDKPQFTVIIKDSYCEVQGVNGEGKFGHLFSRGWTSKIEATYKCILVFIDWYNKKNSEQP